MVPRSKWKYRGMAGHFCAADRCRFHICTDIGEYRISTVGAYYPNPDSKKMEVIGAWHHYETMVFQLDGSGEVSEWQELDVDSVTRPDALDPYEADKLAEAMHERMCLKWAKSSSSSQSGNRRGRSKQSSSTKSKRGGKKQTAS